MRCFVKALCLATNVSLSKARTFCDGLDFLSKILNINEADMRQKSSGSKRQKKTSP